MRKDLFRRYLLFSVSIFINALGISVITKAMLGTSAISSVPYVLSCFTPFTMGQYTIAINLLFVVLELLLMPHQDIRDSKFQLAFQVPVGVCFGWFIDLCMNFILQDLAGFVCGGSHHPAHGLLPAGYGCKLGGKGQCSHGSRRVYRQGNRSAAKM